MIGSRLWPEVHPVQPGPRKDSAPTRHEAVKIQPTGSPQPAEKLRRVQLMSLPLDQR